MDANKTINDMRNKILEIVGKVESGHLEPEEATSKLFDLLVVGVRIEQLCGKKENRLNMCNTCGDTECIDSFCDG
jgi:hypothetical protein